MNTPSAQTYTAGGRAIPPRESFQRQRGIHRERLRVPQRISSTPARLRPIREAENEPPVRPEPHRHHLIMPSPSIEPMIKDPPRPQTPPPELDIPHEGYMLLELKTNVKVSDVHKLGFELQKFLAVEYNIPQHSISAVLLPNVFVSVARAHERCFVATITTLPQFCDLEAKANKKKMGYVHTKLSSALRVHRAFGIVQWHVAPHLRHFDDVHSIPCSVKANADPAERSKENEDATPAAGRLPHAAPSLGTESAKKFYQQSEQREPAERDGQAEEGQQGRQEEQERLKPKKSILKMIFGKN